MQLLSTKFHSIVYALLVTVVLILPTSTNKGLYDTLRVQIGTDSFMHDDTYIVYKIFST
jgi:hypothetical protein